MITIVGAGGYIGGALVEKLRQHGEPHRAIGRDAAALYQGPLGTLVYCAGVTTDFAARPFDTVEAHAGQLCDIFQRADFDRFVYLSSTRVYMGAQATAEDAPLQVQASNPDYLYNLSKLLGENLCRYAPKPATVVRLSNVYGFDGSAANFLPRIINQALTTNEIKFQTALDSAKDYIALPSAVDLLLAIARRGKPQTYNLASGRNVSHGEIAQAISRVTGCRVSVVESARTVIFPPIETTRLRSEFGKPQSSLIADIPQLVETYRAAV